MIFPPEGRSTLPVMPLSRRGIGAGLILGLALAAALTALWLYVQHGSFVLTRIVSPAIESHLDFDTFWRSAVALLNGADIYETGAVYPNLNPPLCTVLLAPFGWLDVLPAYRLMSIITVLLVVGSMVAVASELAVRAAGGMVAVVALLLSSPFLATLGLGQVYGFLTAGLTMCWLAGRRNWIVAEGMALGLVVALKPSLFPLLLLPAAQKKWRTLWVALAAVLLGSLVGVLAAGPSSLPTWLRLVLSKPFETYFDNASLPATIVRLTTQTAWGRPVAELPTILALGSGYVLAGVIVAMTVWRIIRVESAQLGALWVLTAAALLVSPLTWHNYLVLLAPGVLVVLATRRWQLACLLLAVPLIGMEWPSFWYRDGSASAVPLSLYCAILIIYWAAFFSTTGIPSPPPEAQGSVPGTDRAVGNAG